MKISAKLHSLEVFKLFLSNSYKIILYKKEVMDMKHTPLRRISVLLLTAGIIFISGCSNSRAGTKIEETQPIIINDPKRYIESIFPEVAVEKDLVYSEAKNYKGDNEKLLLDIISPSGDTEKNRPAIVWVHGGGFFTGSKDGGIERDFAIEFAKKGYVALSINYRLRENPSTDWEGTIQDATTDLANAVNWLVDNADTYGVNKDHIALAGYSAGGSTIVSLCYGNWETVKWKEDSIFAAVSLAGGESWSGVPPKDSPPAFLIHGTADSAVAFSQTESLAQKLKKAGIEHTLYPLTDASHDITPSYNEIMDVTTKFLHKLLTGKEAVIPNSN